MARKDAPPTTQGSGPALRKLCEAADLSFRQLGRRVAAADPKHYKSGNGVGVTLTRFANGQLPTLPERLWNVALPIIEAAIAERERDERLANPETLRAELDLYRDRLARAERERARTHEVIEQREAELRELHEREFAERGRVDEFRGLIRSREAKLRGQGGWTDAR